MMYKKLLWGVLAFVLVVVACAPTPMGRQQLTLLPQQEVDAMGHAAFQELRQSQRLEASPRINAYVRCVTQAIAAEVPGEQGPWEVSVFRDESANAFALPGGNIGVHTGLLEVAENQHQLAAVIGHEIGHVVANHANERLSQQLAVQGGLGLIDAVIGTGAAVPQGLMTALGIGAQVGILLPYSRVHEREADIIGLDLMARAGFDPRESVVLWENMARAGRGQSPEFLSTHPSYGTRTRDLQEHMGSALQTYEAARAQGKIPRCQRPG